MPSLTDLFGKGSIGEQLLVYNLLGLVIGASVAPGITELQQSSQTDFPVVALPAGTLAGLVARGFVSAQYGAEQALNSGVNGERFAQMVAGAHGAPGGGDLIALLQRGLIVRGDAVPTDQTFDGALANTALEPGWFDLIAKLAVQIPSVAEVMNAWLMGQIEEPEANTRYLAAGGDPTWFQTSYNANGQAPTPMEALEMLNRGVIPSDGAGPASISYHQAFLEGPWRNKWETPFRALGVYIPPPRTVTALYKEGRIDQATAIGFLKDAGMTTELAAAYVAQATAHATDAAKVLSKSEIIDLYEAKLITPDEAHAELVALKYSAADATLEIELADTKAAAAAAKSAVTRLKTLYLAGKNSAAVTTAALHTLGVADAQVTQLLAVWDLEQVSTVKTISPSEYTSAVFYNIMSQADATAGLIGLGYSEYEAWLLISLRSHGPLPGYPGGGPVPPAATA